MMMMMLMIKKKQDGMSHHVKPERKAGGAGKWAWVLIPNISFLSSSQVMACKCPLILEQL